MILLQDAENTVAFDPVYVCYGPQPWYETAFRLYLLFMVLVLVARGLQLVWNLVCLSRLQREVNSSASQFRALWLAAKTRSDLLRRFSVLTLIFVLADFCFAAAGILTQVSTQKTSAIATISRAAAGQLQASALGLLICAALYGTGFFFQSRLARRERSFDQENAREKAAERPRD